MAGIVPESWRDRTMDGYFRHLPRQFLGGKRSEFGRKPQQDGAPSDVGQGPLAQSRLNILFVASVVG